MEKVRYMISDAATMTGVESHVLRYWEDELELTIPRNEMGHRYYTRENIQEFQKIKELKEKGYQLKAIRMLLRNDGQLEETALSFASVPKPNSPAITITAAPPEITAEDKMAQFRELMSNIVGQAIAQNNEELSLSITRDVKETVLKEMNYLFREQEEQAEERYKKIDAAIRGNVRKKHLLFSSKPEKKNATAKEQTAKTKN